MALHALSRMETRKYHSQTADTSSSKEENVDLSDAESTLSTQSEPTNSKCVICLEKFKDGQVSQLSFCHVPITVLCIQFCSENELVRKMGRTWLLDSFMWQAKVL